MTKIGKEVVTSGMIFCMDFSSEQIYQEYGYLDKNRMNQSSDYTAVSPDRYCSQIAFSETWTKVYDPAVLTPVGSGATLTIGSETYGGHYLNRMSANILGGPNSQGFCASAYYYPLNEHQPILGIGLGGDLGNRVSFNLDNGEITYGTGELHKSLAFIEEVAGWPGWYRIGAYVDGRAGGWVGGIGYGNTFNTSFSAGSIPSGYWAGLMENLAPTPNAPYLEAQATQNRIRPQVGPDCSAEDINLYLYDMDDRNSIGMRYIHFVPDSAPMTGSGDFTFSCLVRPDTSDTHSSKYLYKSDDFSILFDYRSNVDSHIDVTIDGTIFTSSTDNNFLFPTGVYYNIDVVREGSSVKLYQNQTLMFNVDISSKSSYNITSDNTELFIRNGNQRQLKLKNFKIYDRALNAQERQQNAS